MQVLQYYACEKRCGSAQNRQCEGKWIQSGGQEMAVVYSNFLDTTSGNVENFKVKLYNCVASSYFW